MLATWLSLSWQPSRARAVIAAGLLALVTALVWLAGVVAERRAVAEIAAAADQSAALLDALLASEIERYRALPMALGTDADVRAALANKNPAARTRLGDRLNALAVRLGAAAIYVIGADGITVVSSNARRPGSFVGQDYRFRSYFSQAMERGAGAQFALGSMTLRPGLYLSQRVEADGRALGVVVVKAEFLGVEADWARAGKPAFVTDANNRVLITSLAGWRFRKPAELGLPAAGGQVTLALPGRDSAERYLLALRPTSIPGWKLGLLSPLEPRVRDATTAARAIALLAIVLLGTAAVSALRRQRRIAADIARREQARANLEARVVARTTELRTANEQLRLEMEERRRIEEQAQTLRHELEQANRLATLGQIAAGVTHEIAQPVAAIRATADNAATFIERNNLPGARAAVGRIARLTERIGAISGELRTFATKSPGGARTFAVDTAIDGALALVGSGLRQKGVRLQRGPRRPELKVKAERVRLEQILVNLLQNALDALHETPSPEIHLLLDDADGQVRLLIEDNGPGVTPEMATSLFTPFRTSKAQGLGLGLVIARDIATALGGELDLLPPQAGRTGARFRLLIPAAR